MVNISVAINIDTRCMIKIFYEQQKAFKNIKKVCVNFDWTDESKSKRVYLKKNICYFKSLMA